MTDIVERLNVSWSSQNGATMTKINRILHERKDAAAEIQRLRAEVERLTDMNAKLVSSVFVARAEERERAAQIAEKQAAEYSGHARDLRYCDSDRRFYAACATRLRDLASLIRQAGKDGGAK